VRCLTCGMKNREAALFCGGCGASLDAARAEPRRRRCARCGTENDPAARFCRDCGQELGVPAPLRERVTIRRLGTVGGLLGAILLLQIIGAPAIVLFLALVPAIIYFTVFVWIDRYEPEPWWLLVGAFLWGASVATLISGIVNVTGRDLVSAELGRDLGQAYLGSISAPIIEELTKGAVLLFVYLRRRDELNGLLDGVVYAGMVGLGFAMTENVGYYTNALQAGTDVLGQTFILRGIITPFLHPLFTAATGIGFVLALRARNRRTRMVAPVAGLGLATVLHSSWNTAPLVLGPLLILPVLVMLVMLVRRSIRHEAQVVRDYLPEGMAPQADVERLSSIRARLADSILAFRHGGLRGFAGREEYVGALSDLAFSRYHAAHATDGAATQQPEGESFRDLVESLRREWRTPTTRVTP
jgi:RsiW-degrading membrane proteinase PrsW (M82 family)